jgi:hypothetical protein
MAHYSRVESAAAGRSHFAGSAGQITGGIMKAMAGLVSAVVTVIRRPQWAVVILVLSLAAFAAQSATSAALFLACFVALPPLGLAAAALNVNLFSPLSVVRSLFTPPSWSRLGLATILLLLDAAVLRVFLYIPRLARRLVAVLGGDVDLFTALLFAAVASLCCATLAVLLPWIHERFGRHQVVDDGTEEAQPPESQPDERLFGYWWQATEALTLATAALIPAALLANWAWNVLASVTLPVFYLSVKDAASDHRGSTAPAEPCDSGARATEDGATENSDSNG